MDAAASGAQEANGHVKGGSFAGAVWAEETNYFSEADVEIYAADDGIAAVVFFQFTHFQHGAHLILAE
jgi:hypothetical protein